MPEENNQGSNILKTIGIIVGVLILIIAIMFLRFWLSNRTNSAASSTKTNTVSTSGNWTLSMTSPVSMTGPETSLQGEGRTSISLQIPSKSGEKITATGDWTSETSGTVGMGTTTGTVTGKITVTGEVKNNKFVFTPTYLPEVCTGTVSTPIGGSTSNTCDPNSIPQPKSITIDITENATATNDVATNYGSYSYDWKEIWKLTK